MSNFRKSSCQSSLVNLAILLSTKKTFFRLFDSPALRFATHFPSLQKSWIPENLCSLKCCAFPSQKNISSFNGRYLRKSTAFVCNFVVFNPKREFIKTVININCIEFNRISLAFMKKRSNSQISHSKNDFAAANMNNSANNMCSIPCH